MQLSLDPSPKLGMLSTAIYIMSSPLIERGQPAGDDANLELTGLRSPLEDLFRSTGLG